MQHDDISTWFILTLSAEQAAFDQDFEHLDALIRRREELLQKWQEHGVTVSEAEAAQLKSAEERLDTALRRVQSAIGQEIRVLTNRKKVASLYKAS
ncbi:MAG: hypothetical protein JST12_00475 [Armatimonadetes bacterium]|nr:hypothetical protein [Armatimonadota bacterium]MBS1700109.1 hypothetical protein [Armatimonadota bacterium]MBS1726749.1 hypothetical protein [Armatimonadota bacterium]